MHLKKLFKQYFYIKIYKGRNIYIQIKIKASEPKEVGSIVRSVESTSLFVRDMDSRATLLCFYGTKASSSGLWTLASMATMLGNRSKIHT